MGSGMTDFATLEAQAAPLLAQVAALAAREPDIAPILGIGVEPRAIAPLLAAILAGTLGEASAREAAATGGAGGFRARCRRA